MMSVGTESNIYIGDQGNFMGQSDDGFSITSELKKPKSTDKLVNKNRRNMLSKFLDTADHPPILERPPYRQELNHHGS